MAASTVSVFLETPIKVPLLVNIAQVCCACMLPLLLLHLVLPAVWSVLVLKSIYHCCIWAGQISGQLLHLHMKPATSHPAGWLLRPLVCAAAAVRIQKLTASRCTHTDMCRVDKTQAVCAQQAASSCQVQHQCELTETEQHHVFCLSGRSL
jgi:hypothetical protein